MSSMMTTLLPSSVVSRSFSKRTSPEVASSSRVIRLKAGKRADARAAFDRVARDASDDTSLANLAVSMRDAIAPQ